jgi:hypothetical protein
VLRALSSSRALARYAWIGGLVFVSFLIAETVASVAIKADQNDSAIKIAGELADHRKTLIVVACLSVAYAAGFIVYLPRLLDLLRVPDDTSRSTFLTSWIAVGGVLFVTLHGVSDIGIDGMVGAKIAAYSVSHDPGLSYMLYLLTFALDSVGDVFGSFFMLGSGLMVLATRVLPRWLGWLAVVASPFLLVQAFGLGGVVSNFGLVLDLIGFLLLLVFVGVSSVIGLLRNDRLSSAS